MHVQLSSGAYMLNLGLSLHLFSYFLWARSKALTRRHFCTGSLEPFWSHMSEVPHMHYVVSDAVGTQQNHPTPTLSNNIFWLRQINYINFIFKFSLIQIYEESDTYQI